MQVSSELLRGNEKDDMAKMISVLAGYGLSYKPEAVARGDADSSYEQTRSPPHVLVPEIDQLVTSFGADEEAPRNKATSKKKPRVPWYTAFLYTGPQIGPRKDLCSKAYKGSNQ